jgi:hypothetical protein
MEPPNLDFSLCVRPAQASIHDLHSLARFRLDTAWANQAVWNAASVTNFCFRKTQTCSNNIDSIHEWQRLWDMNQDWRRERPSSFNELSSCSNGEESVFPVVWFVAEWHGKSHRGRQPT